MRRAALVVFAGLLAGCVREAVLENDVQSAQWKARTLETATDPALAHAALSAQLVELEALYQRDAKDARIGALLERGYLLMARGFIELRRLEATANGDGARAEQEARLRAEAEQRAAFYGPKPRKPLELPLEGALGGAAEACQQHDRAGYERALNDVLASAAPAPEARLQHALGRRLAALWLTPNVALRCGFGSP